MKTFYAEAAAAISAVPQQSRLTASAAQDSISFKLMFYAQSQSAIFMPPPTKWPEALCFQSVRAFLRDSVLEEIYYT